ncbi:CDP-diacylglycerol--serine O-phosphatidyltransferase [Craterilacuibacter sinensis]|uniref:CDP-diacylglycerol--serine O-phosphatidyltransferase n=1 Tax=Craterilacuibacter sinensis TaxID=2686017 RepID=A0A845BQ35_9NEIS|nr:CDP-diacylglycerol--serine O-phosphatidyltransferase [Craterilacuibacter sinensis]MXR36366.1 CDP-diacylglycerol--serine O-phosphatidyltransferase [Craterilacuibacter sinensis]
MLFNDPRSYIHALPRFALAAEDIITLTDTAAFRETLLAHIAKAQHRIYLTALYLQHDEGGAMVLEALYAARKRNPALEIAVLVDWHRAQRGLIGKGKADGNAAWYQDEAAKHPDQEVAVYGVPVQTRELFGVLHLKGFIVDDTVIYSGASLNNVYLHVGERYRYDRYHLITNRGLADSMVALLKDTVLASPAVHRLDQPNPPATKSIRGDIRALRERLSNSHYQSQVQDQAAPGSLGVTPLLGVGKRNPLNRLIQKLMASTRSHLVICTPYFNLPRPLMREIRQLLARGVRVDIIVGDKTANDFFIPPSEPFKVIGALPYLYEANLRRFAQAQQADIDAGRLNLLLWNDPGHSYHLKGLWVDQEFMLITGNNLNPRAFSLDLENGLLLHDPQQQLAAQKEQELAAIRANTSRINHYLDLETVDHYPEPVRKLLTRMNRVRADRLVSRLL